MRIKQEKVGHVKILFDFEEDGGTQVESMWAVPVANGYKIDNIPFYVREVACEDVVSADLDTDGALHFVALVAASGHSTVRLWFANEKDVIEVRESLRNMGCSSEMDLSRLVAVDIPPSIPYERVRAYLDHLEREAVLEYEEACLGQT